MSSNTVWQDVAAMGFFIALGGLIGVVITGFWELVKTIGALPAFGVVLAVGVVLFIGAFVTDVYILE